jgi:hypothetical protein
MVKGHLIMFQFEAVLLARKDSLADMADSQYMGSELEIFAHANTWKSCVHYKLRPYLAGDILEVGAGIPAPPASTTPFILTSILLRPPRIHIDARRIVRHFCSAR